jgi:hypothetical protein
MKFINVLLTSVGLAVLIALFASPSPQASDPTPATYTETTGTATIGTNLIAASATMTNSATAGIIPCGTAENVALMLRSRNTNAVDAATITVKVSRSIDGSIFETVPWFSWVSPTLATTNLNYSFTNVNVGGSRYIKVETIANASTGAVGVVELKYGAKRTQVRTLTQ